jgi:hypothetical protein
VFDEPSKDGLMATSSTTGLTIPVSSPVIAENAVHVSRRRHISPQAGHALEILGHAIEYLADEFVHEGGSFSAHDAQLEAVQLLMARNREVYYSCPEIRSLRERCGMFVRHYIH